MNCIKCGREVSAHQVFCEECLADMEQHPVKPGTPVLLPPQEQRSAPRRSASRRNLKPEELVSILRSIILVLALLAAALAVALSLTAVALHQRIQEDKNSTPPGQNYETGIPAAVALPDCFT